MEHPGIEQATPALQVRGLTRRFDGTLAVDNLSFDVQPGEILGLVGPNGAGKTTTLRSVAGILPLQEGVVCIAGYDLVQDEVAAKQSIAWVPDNPEPFESLTVMEHLEFTAKLYRVDDWRGRAESLVDRFELTEKSKAMGSELSRGMRQKLAFCQAWLPRPRVVLMDEPLSGLDPRGIRSAKQAIRELSAEGTAIVLSSHLLELIEELSARLLIIDHGKRVFMGTLAEARVQCSVEESGSLEDIFLAATGDRRNPPLSEGVDAGAPDDSDAATGQNGSSDARESETAE